MYCFAKFCRLCFKKTSSLLKFDVQDEKGVMLSTKMNYVYPARANKAERTYPPFLCHICYAHLDQAYKFMLFCNNSYRKLEKHRRKLKTVNGVIRKSTAHKFNMSARQLYIQIGPDFALQPPIRVDYRLFASNCEPCTNRNKRFLHRQNRELSSDEESHNWESSSDEDSDLDVYTPPRRINLKRSAEDSWWEHEDVTPNKKTKIRFSDPVHNILTEKKTPKHNMVAKKPIIKSSPKTSVANGIHQPLINNSSHVENNSTIDLNEDQSFRGFDIRLEGAYTKKIKFKTNFYEYSKSLCSFEKNNGVRSVPQKNGLFSDNKLLKKCYKKLESTLINAEDSSVSCRICSTFYKDYNSFLELDKSSQTIARS